jgi:regulator of sigma E protease
VFIHEFGHYYLARLNGVKVEAFAIGFGKELYGRTDKHGTRWKLCAIPLGGYVKMFGDSDPSSSPDFDKLNAMTKKQKKESFYFKTLPQKAAIVFAGPFANYVLAIVVMIFMFSYYGKQFTEATITHVEPNSPAAIAGLEAGDHIVAFDGDEVNSFEDIKQMIAINLGTPIQLTVERKSQQIELTVTPKFKEFDTIFGEKVRMPIIGIASEKIGFHKMGIGESVVASFKESYVLSVQMLKAVGQIITMKRSSDELAGPIRIAKYSGHTASQGVQSFLWFIVLISVNLGLVNLFPIPVLDGGHLLYYLIEAVRGKPMAERFQMVGQYIGMALLLLLTIYVTFNDVKSLFK